MKVVPLICRHLRVTFGLTGGGQGGLGYPVDGFHKAAIKALDKLMPTQPAFTAGGPQNAKPPIARKHKAHQGRSSRSSCPPARPSSRPG
jgi:hypothetical protein